MSAVTDVDAVPDVRAEAAYPKPAYAWYVLGVLLVAFIFSFLDRQILNLLVGPIRRDLQITDTGMSLLSGFGFAIFFALFGFPLARMADSKSRRGLIAAGFVLWSFGVGPAALMEVAPSRMRGQAGALYAFCLNFFGLGFGPTTVALITDYVFHDDNMVGYSLLIVALVTHTAAILILWSGLKSCVRSKHQLEHWRPAQTA